MDLLLRLCGEKKIRLDDDELIDDLLAFLREAGCIAYYDAAGGAIEAIAPHLFGKDEAQRIQTLIEQWQTDYPAVTIEIEG